MPLSNLEIATCKTATQLNLPESIVELVIAHKWKSVYQAQYLYKSIEDSGLGKLSIRTKVVLSRIKKTSNVIEMFERELQDGTALSEKDIKKRQRAIESLIESLKYLETKI